MRFWRRRVTVQSISLQINILQTMINTLSNVKAKAVFNNDLLNLSVMFSNMAFQGEWVNSKWSDHILLNEKLKSLRDDVLAENFDYSIRPNFVGA